ncbi:phage regulatory CII family protein [Luteibacter sp. NPDC031894]|uniref:phage regulatory CII family protein n=1 Tax=Luteibacter sp. NPDC031894 TaxID=3390572 RepID=UPI003D04A758
MNPSTPLMHILDAALQTVSDYPGGAASLAPRVGLTAGVLSNKVNPNCKSNHLTLVEANRLMSVTGDPAILQAMAAEQGYALVKIGDPDEGQGVLHGMLDLGVAEGEFSRELHDALADGRITQNEMSALGRAALAYQSTLIGLLRRLRDEHARQAGSAAGV